MMKPTKNFWMGFFGVYFAIIILTIVWNVAEGNYDLAFWKVMTIFFVVLWFLNSQLVEKAHGLLKESGELTDKMIKLMDTVIAENKELKSRQEFWEKSGEVDIHISRSATALGFKSEPLNLRKNDTRQRNKTKSKENGKQ